MLPLSLLRTAQNHPMLVELKNGETYNGHLVSCDNWMNINLREASSRWTIINVCVFPPLIWVFPGFLLPVWINESSFLSASVAEPFLC